jgi:signal transduction histidine kinase
MKKPVKFFDSLIWKIGSVFLLILMLLSAVYLYIAVWTAEMYYQETMQKLGSQIADHITQKHALVSDGHINNEKLESLFEEIMMINPSLEVYLLDNEGKILTYHAPHKTIVLKKVDLKPILKFIETGGKEFVMGNDPKNPSAHKTFSAAEVRDGDRPASYLYIIMEGEEFKSAAQFMFGSYMLRLALRSTIITLVAAVIISFFALGFITRNLRKISIAIREFKRGNLTSRIAVKGKGELREFADSFNEMADQIVQNMQDLKTMDSLRRELVANVSHDLRTPLASIQGYVETILLKNNSLTEEEKLNYLRITFASTERLNNLVEELFELSKLEARERLPKPEPFQMTELAQDIVQKNQILAQSNKIKLNFESPKGIPIVFADIGMIEKVLQNLLDNAVKFSPENGNVTLRIEPQEDQLVIKITDSGPGIDEEEINHIFDRYRRADKGSRKVDGLGLGLAIVKKILEVHEMEIKVESEVNNGTTFSFAIPFFHREKLQQELKV